jgi:hypothetical protein
MNPGRTYRFYTGQAVVPFGYGLSYTRFQYALDRTPLGQVYSVASGGNGGGEKQQQNQQQKHAVSLAPVKKALASFYAAKKKEQKMDSNNNVDGAASSSSTSSSSTTTSSTSSSSSTSTSADRSVPSFPSHATLARSLAGPYVINVTNVGDYDAEDAVLGMIY